MPERSSVTITLTNPALREITMLRPFVCLSGLVVAVAGTAGAASAQTGQATSGDIAVGYAYLHDAQFELPAGWLFSAAGSLTPTIGIVVEIGGNYHGLDGARVSEHSFVGGVRFQAPNASMVTPFAQLLAGTSLFGATDSGRSDSFL